jgi:hypothetical protein
MVQASRRVVPSKKFLVGNPFIISTRFLPLGVILAATAAPAVQDSRRVVLAEEYVVRNPLVGRQTQGLIVIPDVPIQTMGPIKFLIWLASRGG